MRICITPGCGRKHRARGYCGSCYNQHFAKAAPLRLHHCTVCGTPMLRRDTRRVIACGYACRAFIQWGKWPHGVESARSTRRALAMAKLAYRPERSRTRWYAGECHGCSKQFISATVQDRWCSVQCRARQAGERRRARLLDAFVEPVNRTAIFQRDGWRCQICHGAVARTKTVPHPKSPVIDHIIPLAKGGTHERANVQCAHFMCNSIKRDNAANDQLLLFG